MGGGCCSSDATMVSSDSSGPAFEIHYFDIYGRAHQVRMACWYVGCKYIDKRYTFEQWGQTKPTGKMMWGSMPTIFEPNGTQRG